MQPARHTACCWPSSNVHGYTWFLHADKAWARCHRPQWRRWVPVMTLSGDLTHSPNWHSGPFWVHPAFRGSWGCKFCSSPLTESPPQPLITETVFLDSLLYNDGRCLSQGSFTPSSRGVYAAVDCESHVLCPQTAATTTTAPCLESGEQQTLKICRRNAGMRMVRPALVWFTEQSCFALQMSAWWSLRFALQHGDPFVLHARPSGSRKLW